MGRDNTHTEVLLAGAFAAFTVDLLVYPLDTIKTRLQSQDYIKTYSSSSTPSNTAAALRHTARSPYALRGLYQGVGSVVIATLPASGIFFSTYESAKHVVGSVLPGAVSGGSKAPPAAVVHSLSSGIAELASCLVLTPAEVIKQNAQMIQKAAATTTTTTTATKASAVKPSMSSSLQALQMLRNAEGGASRRLWSGYSALVARNLPFTALQFPMFEALRMRLLAQWGVSSDVGKGSAGDRQTGHQLLLVGAANGLSAGLSGSVAAVVTTPTDVVKTRMMLSAGSPSAKISSRTSSSSSSGHREQPSADDAMQKGQAAKAVRPRHMNGLQLARLVYQEHGMRGLFRGGALRAAWTFVGSGLYLGTYEVAKAWLRSGREADDEDGDNI